MRWLVWLCPIVFLAGCVTTPEELQNQNRMLENEITNYQAKVTSMEQTQRKLRSDLNEEKRLKEICLNEKGVRFQESTDLRSQIRSFIKGQIGDYRGFMKNSIINDTIGYEITKRAYDDGQQLLLVDTKNRVPKPGTVNFVSGYFNGPSTFQVMVLRSVEDRYLVVWKSNDIAITKAGENVVDFPVPISVEEGDLFAYYFPEAVNIPYDRGSGEVFYKKKKALQIGDAIKVDGLEGRSEHRAYSIAMYGLF